MACTRDDVQDSTGQRTFISGRGHMRAWPGQSNRGDYNTTTGVPANGTRGYANSCIWQNFLGAAGTELYHNTGTEASSVWQVFGTLTPTFTSITVTTLTATTVITDVIDMSAAASVFTVKANTQHALEITDGTTIIQDVDTRNTIANVQNVTLTASNPTIATAAAVHQNSTLNLAAKTITYTGTNTVTSSLGAGLSIGAPTFTDASAGTITTVSNVHVAQVAAAGGSLTITNARMISTGVSDCFLTNAGVWTDTACFSWGKEKIEDAQDWMIEHVLGKLVPRTWQYKEDGPHGNDRGRERVGIVYDELPDELLAPGEHTGVSVGVLASFALAALKHLAAENQMLKQRLDAAGL